jgi:hypothetical protein
MQACRLGRLSVYVDKTIYKCGQGDAHNAPPRLEACRLGRLSIYVAQAMPIAHHLISRHVGSADCLSMWTILSIYVAQAMPIARHLISSVCRHMALNLPCDAPAPTPQPSARLSAVVLWRADQDALGAQRGICLSVCQEEGQAQLQD